MIICNKVERKVYLALENWRIRAEQASPSAKIIEEVDVIFEKYSPQYKGQDYLVVREMTRKEFVEFYTKDFMWVVHSDNPGNREYIRDKIEKYMSDK